MADVITIICPQCEKAIKAPESVVGKKIRCKECGETFVAKAPKTAIKPDKSDKPGGGKKKPPDKAKKKDDDQGPIKLKDEDEGEQEGSYGVKDEYLGAR